MAETEKLYEPIRASLEMLSGEFKRASRMYPPLRHDMLCLWPLGSRLPMFDKQAWISFLEAQRDPSSYLEFGEWHDGEVWHGPHAGQPLLFSIDPKGNRHDIGFPWCGRFHGEPEGLDEFKQLAESLYLVLCQMRNPVPWEQQGWVNILLLLHQLALKQPTPLIRVKKDRWDRDPQGKRLYTEADFQDHGVDPGRKGWDARGFCPNPDRWSLESNLFSATNALIHHVLNPNSILLIGDDEAPYYPHTFPALPNQPKLKNPEIAGQAEDGHYVFQLQGEMWCLRFPGDQPGSFRKSEGFAHFAMLLKRPNVPVKVSDLSPPERNVEIRDIPKPRAQEDNQDLPKKRRKGDRVDDVMDKKTIAAVENRIRELEDRLEIAKDTGNEDIAEIRDEIEEERTYLRSGTYRGNSTQFLSPRIVESARNRVKINLERCIEKLSITMPCLANHLGAFVSPVMGIAYQYKTDGLAKWKL